jgi:hypothetical protein
MSRPVKSPFACVLGVLTALALLALLAYVAWYHHLPPFLDKHGRG